MNVLIIFAHDYYNIFIGTHNFTTLPNWTPIGRPTVYYIHTHMHTLQHLNMRKCLKYPYVAVPLPQQFLGMAFFNLHLI